jgi:HEAT repeat protein
MVWFKKLFGGGAAPDPVESAAVPALVAELGSADPAVRLRACRALGDLGGRARSATERLQQLFNDPDGDVCNAAADAYSRIERGF